MDLTKFTPTLAGGKLSYCYVEYSNCILEHWDE